MVPKLIAVVCLLTHTLTPCCLAACRMRSEVARAGKTSVCTPASNPSKGCCAVKQTCAARCGPQSPAQPASSRNCAECKCRPIKEPLGPSTSTTPERSLTGGFTPAPDIVHDAAATPVCGGLAVRSAHDPPGLPGSHNARLAQTAVWLK